MPVVPTVESTDAVPEPRPFQSTAARLMDAWQNTHGERPLPWRVAVEICAVCERLPELERQRLLDLDSEA